MIYEDVVYLVMVPIDESASERIDARMKAGELHKVTIMTGVEFPPSQVCCSLSYTALRLQSCDSLRLTPHMKSRMNAIDRFCVHMLAVADVVSVEC